MFLFTVRRSAPKKKKEDKENLENRSKDHYLLEGPLDLLFSFDVPGHNVFT